MHQFWDGLGAIIVLPSSISYVCNASKELGLLKATTSSLLLGMDQKRNFCVSVLFFIVLYIVVPYPHK